MKKYLLLLPLVLALGCIEGAAQPGTGVGGSNGVRITSFEPETTEIHGSGVETFELFLEVQNVGDSIASGITAEIFNYADFIGTTNASLGTLDPPGGGLPGETQDYTYVFTVPKRELGIDDTVELGGRVQYDYATHGRVDVPIVPKEEWEAQELAGRAGYQKEKSSSSGPIRVDVDVTKSPVIVSDRFDTFTIKVEMTNVGSGSLRSREYGYDTLDSVDLIVPAGFELGEYCDFVGSLTGNGGVLALQNDPQRLKLTLGKHRSLNCRLKATNLDVENVYQFSAVARYRYQIDAFTTVLVVGTETV